MLVEVAVGDAYGAGFEFRNSLYVRLFNRTDHHGRPALSLSRGRYTDDTQMTIAVAETMLSGQPWTPEVLAEHFVLAFKRDPRPGYAPGFYRFLKSVDDGADFLSRIRPNSERSGAAMRAGPIGLLPHLDEVLERAETQARVTHDTTGGVASAQAATLMAHFFAHVGGSIEELPAFINTHIPGPWEQPWKGRVSMRGVDCVHAAITAITAVAESRSLERLLHRCIAFGGDVDTVAAIAMAAAACSHDFKHDLPDALLDGLETGPYGMAFIRELDDGLAAFARSFG